MIFDEIFYILYIYFPSRHNDRTLDILFFLILFLKKRW